MLAGLSFTSGPIAAGAAVAAAVVEATTVDNSGGLFQSSTTFSHDNPVAGTKLLAFVLPHNETTADIAGLTATYADVSMANLGAAKINGKEAHLFEMDSPATGINDLVVSATDSIRTVIVIYSLSNAGTPRAVATDTFTSVDETDDPISLVVTSQDGDLVLWGIAWRNSAASLTFGAGQTGVSDDGLNGQSSRGGAAWKGAVTGSTTTMDGTLTNSSSTNVAAMVGVAIP